jgi:hypothetical protein
MGPFVLNFLKNVHVPSWKAHPKINKEHWLRLGKRKSYLGQRRVQIK